jgi:hypothetical protein
MTSAAWEEEKHLLLQELQQEKLAYAELQKQLRLNTNQADEKIRENNVLALQCGSLAEELSQSEARNASLQQELTAQASRLEELHKQLLSAQAGTRLTAVQTCQAGISRTGANLHRRAGACVGRNDG